MNRIDILTFLLLTLASTVTAKGAGGGSSGGSSGGGGGSGGGKSGSKSSKSSKSSKTSTSSTKPKATGGSISSSKRTTIIIAVVVVTVCLFFIGITVWYHLRKRRQASQATQGGHSINSKDYKAPAVKERDLEGYGSDGSSLKDEKDLGVAKPMTVAQWGMPSIVVSNANTAYQPVHNPGN